MAARKVHTLEAGGSIPSSAILSKRKSIFLIFNLEDTLCYIQEANIREENERIEMMIMTKEQKELVITSLVKFVERVASGKEVGMISKEEIEILPAISEILLKTKTKVII